MDSSTKMFGAISRNDADAVRAVIEEDPAVLHLYFLRDSWLHKAAQLGRIEIMEILVSAGIPVEKLTDDEEETALHTAAGQGQGRACEWLLNHGADINHGLGRQATPIFSAVFSNSLDLVDFFAARGADLSATFGDPPVDLLSYAEQYGTPEIAAYLRGRAK